jgi:hypothetical protein
MKIEVAASEPARWIETGPPGFGPGARRLRPPFAQRRVNGKKLIMPKKKFRIVTYSLLGFVLIFLSISVHFIIQARKHERQFPNIVNGMKQSNVIGLMGNPDQIITKINFDEPAIKDTFESEFFLKRKADEAYFYHDRFFPQFGAIAFNQRGEVIDTYWYSSP